MSINYKYGTFKTSQIDKFKETVRKQIFFLLLIVDPSTADNFDVDVTEAFKNVQYKLNGFNSLVENSDRTITAACLLEQALDNYLNNFNYKVYRKLVLDAGREIEEVVSDAQP